MGRHRSFRCMQNKTMYGGTHWAQDKARQGGVGLLLSKQASKGLIDRNLVSPKVISERFSWARTQHHNHSGICADHKPHRQCCWQLLQHATTHDLHCTKKRKIIMGDFNAQVGTDNITWSGILGHTGYESMKERGKWLLQFCSTNMLSIMNTWFIHKLSRTWISPGDLTRKMIDYIMINQR